jgi:tetratricopeptide (TPR) repeat protein
MGGTEARKSLAEAVAAYRQALEVYTREQLPQDWARTQNNLGVVLQAQGICAAGAEGQAILAEAVAAYRQALEVYTREALPQDWARTQNNLGDARATLGEYGHDAELLKKAKTAIQAVYAFYTDSGDTQYADYFERKLSSIAQLIEELK